MAFQFFLVPILDSAAATTELNGFLQSHRIVAVERHLVEQGGSTFWAFCIDYLAAGAPKTTGANHAPPGRERVDYRDVLKAEDFAIFSRLRDWRKDLAQKEGIPVYTIFNNEQLAQMVKNRATTKAALEQIAGVGDARVQKFGDRVLAILSPCWGQANETNGEPVRANP